MTKGSRDVDEKLSIRGSTEMLLNYQILSTQSFLRLFIGYSYLHLWPRWHSGKASGSRSKGRVFETDTGHI